MAEESYTLRGQVYGKNEEEAVAGLARLISQDDMAGVIFFASASYDPSRIAAAMNGAFSCPVAGCTTAGEICSSYAEGGIVGVSFSSKAFCIHTRFLPGLDDFQLDSVSGLSGELERKLAFSKQLDPSKMFGVLLIDGLSRMEETVAAALYSAMGGIPIIGGSAGDGLDFIETMVFADGEFSSNAAVFILLETLLPFRTFKLQHFAPSDMEMVITEADAPNRVVHEIDGGPAAQEYANIIGLPGEELGAQVFAMYPVMLQIGDDWYVRSIEKVNEDGSLTFFCAIDNGLPLTVARGIGLRETLAAKVVELTGEFPGIELTLGFDCILRRLEIMENGLAEEVEEELSKLKFIGFSTYGEQFNSIHVNQTLTGVVIGGGVSL